MRFGMATVKYIKWKRIFPWCFWMLCIFRNEICFFIADSIFPPSEFGFVAWAPFGESTTQQRITSTHNGGLTCSNSAWFLVANRWTKWNSTHSSAEYSSVISFQNNTHSIEYFFYTLQTKSKQVLLTVLFIAILFYLMYIEPECWLRVRQEIE